MAKILIIEDENLVANSIAIALAKAGHAVVLAQNGREGLALFANESPDLVITDIIMPEIDGLETIQALRAISAQLPIIAISGGGRIQAFDFLRVAYKLGATDVLRKPFTNRALITLVTKYVSGQ